MWIRAYIIRGGEVRFKEATEAAAAKDRFDARPKTGTLATTAHPKFQAGEFIDMGGGQILELLECRGSGQNAQCTVQLTLSELRPARDVENVPPKLSVAL